METLHTATLASLRDSAETLVELAKLMPQGCIVYAERESGVFLEKFDLETMLNDLPDFTYGKIFHEKVELRWQYLENQVYEIQVLTETPDEVRTLLNYKQLARLSFDAEKHKVLLWGTHVQHLEDDHDLKTSNEDVWIETRIPRGLSYPVAIAKHVHVETVRYYDEMGYLRTERWVRLKGSDNR